MITYNPISLFERITWDASLTDEFKLRRSVQLQLLQMPFIKVRDISLAVHEVIYYYKLRMKRNKLLGITIGDTKDEILEDPKLLSNRLEMMISYQAVKDIQKKYQGYKYVWLPSGAINPDPMHMMRYGKIYTITNKNDLPAISHYGCRCGMRIITDENNQEYI